MSTNWLRQTSRVTTSIESLENWKCRRFGNFRENFAEKSCHGNLTFIANVTFFGIVHRACFYTLNTTWVNASSI